MESQAAASVASVGDVVALLGADEFRTVKPSESPAYFDARILTKKPTEQDLFERAISAAWMAHVQDHGVSAPSICQEDPDLPIETIRELLGTPRFQQALADRGIPATDREPLSPQMVAALRTVADPTLGLTERQRIKMLGISWTTYQGWMDYTPFRRQYRMLAKKALSATVDRAPLVLAELINDKNLNAIIYANEMTGVFVRGQQEQQNFTRLTLVLMSKLQKRITDPELLNAIADDIQEVLASGGIQAPELILEAEVVE